MRRYGYLDMPEGWSDVDSSRVLAQCVDCGCVAEVDAEATWLDDGERYTACGCAGLWDEAPMYEHSDQCPWNRNQSDELEELTEPEDWDLCGDPDDYNDGWDQADLEWSSRCDSGSDDDEREPRLRDWSEL